MTGIAKSTIVLSCLLALATPFAPEGLVCAVSAKAEKGSPAQRAQLEVKVEDQKVGDKVFQVAKMTVHAKPEQVWQVLADYDHAPRVFPRLQKCDVLEDHGTTKVLYHEVRPSGPFGTFDYVLHLREVAPKRMEWHRLSGDFKEVDGYWKLEPTADGRATHVTYACHVNGGLFMPQSLVRRQVRADMPEVMFCLKTQVERNQQIARTNGVTSRSN